MTLRCMLYAAVVAAAMVVAGLDSTAIAGQGQPAASGARPAAIAKTPDGQPDVQGMWLFFDTIPLETPGGTRVRKRPGDAVAGENDAARRAAPEGSTPFYAEAALRRPTSDRKAMVVDPPDGRVPVKTAAVDANDQLTDHFYDSYTNIPSATRCITRGVPGTMLSGTIDSGIRIIQGPGVVSLVHEFMHETRVIPLDAGPHLPKNVHLWTGDPRGHWEGNTLVIDSTNYNTRGSVTNNGGSGYLQGIRQSEALHVTERFAMTSRDTIEYEVTIEDPNVYDRPWKVARTLTRDDKYRMFEYACHEGNYRFMTITLGGGRLREKGAEAQAMAASASRKAAEAAARAK